MGDDPAVTIGEEDVRSLARAAALPLGPGRAAGLARALEADLRLLRVLRGVDARDLHPRGSGSILEDVDG
ncbi:MAG: hypothetical protein NVSMB65_06020 [Chloroflexota bacterium]